MSAEPNSDLPLPPGFRAGGMAAGIKRFGPDLGILVADEATPIHAAFTRNSLLGAHIPVCREHLTQSHGHARAVVVNSGNANCATGREGIANARRICTMAARVLDCPTHEVLSISTGVIGAQLPIGRILDALPELCSRARDGGGGEFARAIMTTDTVPKFATANRGDVRVTGIAKGAGMVHPNLATMLAFLLTDASPGDDLARTSGSILERSFHRLTIDGDTSPNDTVLFWHGATPDGVVDDALLHVSQDLCRQIAADGEGATRSVTIEVRGAVSSSQATDVGRAIGTSLLTKTAIAGRDPNWGRILSAAGQTATFDATRARVWIGDVDVYREGEPLPQNENEASQHLRESTAVCLGVDLAIGGESADVWTCDLTRDYVSINADYRS